MFEEFLLQSHKSFDDKHVLFEGFSRSWRMREFLVDVKKVAHALAGIREQAPSIVGIKCRNFYHHWLVIFALDQLGIASASLPNDTGVTFHENFNIIQPDLMLCDEVLSAYRVKNILINERWFSDILSKGGVFLDRYKNTSFARVSVASGTGVTAEKIGATAEYIIQNINNILHSNLLSFSYKKGEKKPQLISCIGFDILTGFQIIMAAMVAGVTVEITDRTHIATVLARNTPLVLILSPLHLEYVIGILSPLSTARDNLNIIIVGGSLPKQLRKITTQKLTKKIHVVYGTEETGLVAVQNDKLDWSMNSVGSVLPWVEVEVVDENGHILAEGQEGSVRIKSSSVLPPQFFLGPKAGEKFQNGWFYPGDRGYLKSSNRELFITGRYDDLVSFGGDKFDLRLLDDIVKSFSPIIDGSVFPVPDQNGILKPYVAVVCEDNFDGDELSRKMHEKYENLPSITLIWVNEIPRLSDGRPNRKLMTDSISETLKK
ncbi:MULTISPECIES: class I adenylate-forming enzyme family protein [Acetobacter]|uniref:3-hydroxybenzoate--CoA/4-hydroxybenzoate--CoA ligase n=1 Tax=Acetobacter pomorum DM001 TaxID=945681 RepID=F1YV51_9PROT|nr:MULTISPECIES: class I adenylate-forming enzyme family protein [Acetobacter]ATI11982.1 long-chain fatty acid--CoA ligase [Acetobacter pomorum]AXC25650.1 long-chain fatty acid--CoA ligase [Acetobacter sp. JWB]EGE47156.1 3-hydroxybenzoate--CoA/4-hydroxybenzoate--CoA ligase [Acetobacter pomorum DM001]KAA8420572.1 acyl--CoA ligase [Acetobacter pomorum]KAA8431203.1 acyl--CoA ligase [Acetobacter pomorum]